MKHLQAKWHMAWVLTHTHSWQTQSPNLSGKQPLIASITTALRPINKTPWTHHYIIYCMLLVKCHLTRSGMLRWVTTNVTAPPATSASNDVCFCTCFCSLFQWGVVYYSKLSKQERESYLVPLKPALLFPSISTNQHDNLGQITCSASPT